MTNDTDHHPPILTPTEFGTIFRALERRQGTGPELILPSLEAIRRAVRLGEGPAAALVQGWRGQITPSVVDAVEIILLAEPGAISREEAEALLAIHHAAVRRCPEWDDLLVGAVAQYMTHASGHPVRARSRSLSASGGLVRRGIAPEVAKWLMDLVGERPSEAERVLIHFSCSEPTEFERMTHSPMAIPAE